MVIQLRHLNAQFLNLPPTHKNVHKITLLNAKKDHAVIPILLLKSIY